MGSNKNKNDAPLASIIGEQRSYSLNYGELQKLENHCNILKDFARTPLINGRKLHKNSKKLADLQAEISEEGQALNERRAKLHEFQNDPKTTPDSKAEIETLMADLIVQTKAFNVKKYDVDLFVVPVSDYPDVPEKFGKKTIPMQNAPAVELEYYPSFLELTDVIIVD